MSDKTIGFIGLGLIGGSIAKALRRVHPEYRLIAYNRSRSSLVEAMSDGTINQATDVIDASFAECDFIFLCMPVSVNIQCLKKLKDLVPDTCVITDVGSVKSTIHEAVRELGMETRFIGGHPMAGREKFGYDASNAELFRGASMILTPCEDVPAEDLARAQALFYELGFGRMCICTPAEHDRMIAYTSQLAHVVSSAYVQSPASLSHVGFSAGSFQDMTRVARLYEPMWTELFLNNAEPLAMEIDGLVERLQAFSDAIRSGDRQGLFEMLHRGRVRKELLNEREKQR